MFSLIMFKRKRIEPVSIRNSVLTTNEAKNDDSENKLM